VQADIVHAGAAAAVTVEAGQRLQAAWYQRLAKNVQVPLNVFALTHKSSADEISRGQN
jgi:hypothetical protein